MICQEERTESGFVFCLRDSALETSQSLSLKPSERGWGLGSVTSPFGIPSKRAEAQCSSSPFPVCCVPVVETGLTPASPACFRCVF